MPEEEIISYITQAQRHGLTEAEIKQNLLNAGWEAEVVEQSFNFAKAVQTNPSTTANQPHQTASPAKPEMAQQASISLSVSGQNVIAQPAKRPIFKNPILWVVTVVILLLAGAAYGYYNYINVTPTSVWSAYLKAKKNPTVKSIYSITYNDSTESSSGSSSTQATVVSFTGNTAADMSDPANIKMDDKAGLNFQLGNLSYNANFEFILSGSVLYLNLSQISQLQSILGGMGISWLKIDPAELQKYMDANSSTLGTSLPSMQLSSQLNSQLMAIWTKPGIITPTNFLAKESINGVSTYHLKLQVNQAQLDSSIVSSLEAIQSYESSSTPFNDEEKAALEAILNKIQIQDYEVWIGQKDSQLYKIELAVSAPTLSDFSGKSALGGLGFMGVAQAKSRDSRRLADVRQIATALQLFNDTYSGYPEGVNGVPQNMVPTFISMMPTAPIPADDSCTNYYNTYWYTATGKPKIVQGIKIYPSYTLTFCLGQATGGYAAGIGMLTPQNITGGIPCPTTPANCVNSNPFSGPEQSEIENEINQMSFKAQLEYNATYSDYGVPQNIESPATSTDLINLIKGYAGNQSLTN
jgi:hypothetical protein